LVQVAMEVNWGEMQFLPRDPSSLPQEPDRRAQPEHQAVVKPWQACGYGTVE
jgi:hypothetical protein